MALELGLVIVVGVEMTVKAEMGTNPGCLPLDFGPGLASIPDPDNFYSETFASMALDNRMFCQ